MSSAKRHQFAALSIAALIGGFACATLYEPESRKVCVVDADCEAGEFCSAEQGGCIETQGTPRRPDFAFVIKTAIKPDIWLGALSKTSRGEIKAELEIAGCELNPAPAGILDAHLFEHAQISYLGNLTSRRLPKVSCDLDCEDLERCGDDRSCVSAVSGSLSWASRSVAGRVDPAQTSSSALPAGPDWGTDSIGSVALVRCGEDSPYFLSGNDLALVQSLATTDDTYYNTQANDPDSAELPPFYAAVPGHACSPSMPVDEIGWVFPTECHTLGNVSLRLAPGSVESGMPIKVAFSVRFDGQTSNFGGRSTIMSPLERVSATGILPTRKGTIGCNLDETCRNKLGEGFACGEDLTCGVDLRNKLAGRTQLELDGTAETFAHALPIATYCESAPSDSFTRYFEIETQPTAPETGAGATVIPSTKSAYAATIRAANAFFVPRETDLHACIPVWNNVSRATQLVTTDASALFLTQPVRLLPERLCCDASCLSQTDAELQECSRPPDEWAAAIAIKGTWSLSAKSIEEWRQATCTPPRDPSNAAEFKPETECTAQGICSTYLPATKNETDSFSYSVRIETPASSIYRSRYAAFAANSPSNAAPEQLVVPTPQLRPVIRGNVACAPEFAESCSQGQAVVMAERLAEPQHVAEKVDPIGPFFFWQRVPLAAANGGGRFALPVEPGRYVITALPQPGQAGGPAAFQLVDVHDGSAELIFDGSSGLWATDISNPQTQLILRPGDPVRLHLAGFASTSTVSALDTGSWLSDENHPLVLENLDLNSKTTCLPLDRGCSIRTLRRPTAGGLDGTSLDFTSTAHFTARKSSRIDCPLAARQR